MPPLLRAFTATCFAACSTLFFAAAASAGQRADTEAARPPHAAQQQSTRGSEEPASPPYDLVIRNGRVMDPETRLDQAGLNVGVRNGRIVAITPAPISGAKEIDATGSVVAPGFIDLISYAPNRIGAWNKIADGVTTNLAMHGGASNPDAWYAQYQRVPPPVNYGASFFYTEARNRLNISRYRPASKQQIESLVATGEKALKQGALGVSFSLEYVPGIGADEILPLMHLAKRYNVPVFFHARYSTMDGPHNNLEGLNEIIAYARKTGAAVHIDHINSTGGTYSMMQSLRMIQAARDEGLDITADTYPYDFWATYLDSARFDEGWQQRFHISFADLQLGGSSERLTPESFRTYRRQGKVAVAYAIPEDDVIRALQCPFVMIASDGILEPGYNNHPRASATFSRTIAYYVREKKVLTLMDALVKMSLMPAQQMEGSSPAFKRKGRLSLGADADIVVFDYDRIQDRATVEHPEYASAGIEYVVLGGTVVKYPVVKDPGVKGPGAKTNRRAMGLPLRRNWESQPGAEVIVASQREKKPADGAKPSGM